MNWIKFSVPFLKCQLSTLKPVGNPQFRMINTKSSKIKIKLNQDISKLSSKSQFYQFFEHNNHQLNIVNYISYLKRFNEITQDQGDQEFIKHIQIVLEQIERFIKGQLYMDHGDQVRDISRAFLMLIIQCVKLKKHFINDDRLLVDLSIQAVKYLEDDTNFDNLNQNEVANYFRSCTQMGYQFVVQKQQFKLMDDKKLQTYKLLTLTSLIHSLSYLEELDDQVYKNVSKAIQNRMDIETLSEYDLYNIFSSAPKQHQLKKDYSTLITKSLDLLIIQRTILPIKTIAVILYQFHKLQISFDENKYFKYIEFQLKTTKLEDFEIWMLSYILKFYEDNTSLKLVIPQENLKIILQQKKQDFQFLALIFASLIKLDIIDNELMNIFQKHYEGVTLTITELSLLFYASSLLSKTFQQTEYFVEYTVQQLLQMERSDNNQTLLYIKAAALRDNYRKHILVIEEKIQKLMRLHA